jgi:hypothetical protein
MDELGAKRWWKYPSGSGDLAKAIITALNHIQQNTLGLQTRFLRNMRSFGGYGYMTGARFPASTGAGGPLSQGQRTGPRDNIIYTVISTVCSQLLDDGPPGVAFLTSHGNYEQQHRAELLEKFTDGLLTQCNFDEESILSLFDACICGTGFAEFYEDADSTIMAERVFPAEYVVDIFDGRDRKPRCLFRVGFIDRDVLAARYPKSKKRILEMTPMALPGWQTTSSGSMTNVIPWIKAWRLPSSKTANDGRHTVVLANDLVLFDDEYHEKDFPVTVLRYELLPTGYHGMGLGELLAGHQLSLNNANTAEYWAWSQVALPRIWAQTGTLDKNHLTSSMSGTILEGTVKPEVLNWSATHPDFVSWKRDLKASAFQLAGVSTMTAQGIKPPGLDSGEAQREFKDTQHSRFSILSQRWQQFRVDAAYKSIAAARQALDLDGSYIVKIIGKNLYTEIDLKNCLMDEDQFVIQAKPVSQIPKTLAGQIQTGTEMLQSRLFELEDARKVITAIPDVGAAADLENAAFDNAKRAAYLMLHEGKMQKPDGALQNLDLLQRVITAETLRAMDNEAPQERINMALQYLALIKAEKQKIMPPPGPMPAPPPGAPPGGGQPIGVKGAPPQVSPLLPFAQPKAA